MVDWWWLPIVFYAGVAIGVAITQPWRKTISSEVEAWLKGRSE